jgi:hypothetical protein
MIDPQTFLKLFGPLPFILVLAVGALVVFSVYMILGGAAARYEKLSGTISPGFLRTSVRDLLPWDMIRALSDMSSELWRKTEVSFFGGRWSHSRGTIRSLSKRRDKWLSFALNIRGGKGRIELRTSSDSFSLEYAHPQGMFRMNGTPVGYINNENNILDQNQVPIGYIHYHRAFVPMGSAYSKTIELSGRRIAEVRPLSDFGDRLWKAPPLIQDMSPEISEKEAKWIIAVIAKSLYSHCRTTRLT